VSSLLGQTHQQISDELGLPTDDDHLDAPRDSSPDQRTDSPLDEALLAMLSSLSVWAEPPVGAEESIVRAIGHERRSGHQPAADGHRQHRALVWHRRLTRRQTPGAETSAVRDAQDETV
jgi:hypothetical protein